jgi:hypothetical protein
MITRYAGAAVGLSGGTICGLALLGAIMAGRAHMIKVGVSLGMLVGTVFIACAVAWTRFGEYVGQNGWWWLGGGLVAGLGLGEVVFRLRPARRINTDSSPLGAQSRPVLLAMVVVAALATVITVALTASPSP